jgi:hypothetical protein
LVDNAQRELCEEDAQLLTRTDLAGLRAAFVDENADHVILGGGLDVATRGDAGREAFRHRDKATAHMKDQLSGPEGFVPFARAPLRGLADHEPKSSPNAVLRAQRPDRRRGVGIRVSSI